MFSAFLSILLFCSQANALPGNPLGLFIKRCGPDCIDAELHNAKLDALTRVVEVDTEDLRYDTAGSVEYIAKEIKNAWSEGGLLKMIFAMLSKGFYRMMEDNLPDPRELVLAQYASVTAKIRSSKIFQHYFLTSYKKSIWSMAVAKINEVLTPIFESQCRSLPSPAFSPPIVGGLEMSIPIPAMCTNALVFILKRVMSHIAIFLNETVIPTVAKHVDACDETCVETIQAFLFQPLGKAIKKITAGPTVKKMFAFVNETVIMHINAAKEARENELDRFAKRSCRVPSDMREAEKTSIFDRSQTIINSFKELADSVDSSWAEISHWEENEPVEESGAEDSKEEESGAEDSEEKATTPVDLEEEGRSDNPEEEAGQETTIEDGSSPDRRLLLAEISALRIHSSKKSGTGMMILRAGDSNTQKQKQKQQEQRKLPSCTFVKYWTMIREECALPDKKGNTEKICNYANNCGDVPPPVRQECKDTAEQLNDILLQVKYAREDNTCCSGDGPSPIVSSQTQNQSQNQTTALKKKKKSRDLLSDVDNIVFVLTILLDRLIIMDSVINYAEPYMRSAFLSITSRIHSQVSSNDKNEAMLSKLRPKNKTNTTWINGGEKYDEAWKKTREWKRGSMVAECKKGVFNLKDCKNNVCGSQIKDSDGERTCKTGG